MKINIRADSVEISGYVNAVERNSKPLCSRLGRFIERICKGAFSNALKRNDNVHVLLNHDWTRDLGSTKQGNLELCEDNIGLYARAVITDPDVIQDAKHGNLVGWSFGFEDVPDGVEDGMEGGFPLRKVRDMNLYEVSILNRAKTPAYDGTLIMARADDEPIFHGEAFIDDIDIREEPKTVESDFKETEDASIRATDQANELQPQQDEHPEAINYSLYEDMISEMKGEQK